MENTSLQKIFFYTYEHKVSEHATKETHRDALSEPLQ